MSETVNTLAPEPKTGKQGIASFLALFTSTGTLLCCALPATIAAFAGGAAVASFVSTFPWLIPLSENKGWIFLGSGLMILLSTVLVFRPQGTVACSITGGEGCEIAGRFTKIVLGLSITIFLIGAFSAYLLVPVLRFIDG
jgi:mercuric ion transport protein